MQKEYSELKYSYEQVRHQLEAKAHENEQMRQANLNLDMKTKQQQEQISQLSYKLQQVELGAKGEIEKYSQHVFASQSKLEQVSNELHNKSGLTERL